MATPVHDHAADISYLRSARGSLFGALYSDDMPSAVRNHATVALRHVDACLRHLGVPVPDDTLKLDNVAGDYVAGRIPLSEAVQARATRAGLPPIDAPTLAGLALLLDVCVHRSTISRGARTHCQHWYQDDGPCCWCASVEPSSNSNSECVAEP